MKKPSLWLNKLTNKHFAFLWLFFHVGLILYFLVSVIFRHGEIGLDADLMNMFPASFNQEAVKKADDQLTTSRANNMFILVSNEDFKEAKNVAVQVYEQLKDSPKFTKVSLYSGMEQTDEILDFLHKYRWNLLDDKTIDEINSPGGAETFAENALAKIYGAFTMTSLDNLDTDPFMLTEHGLNIYLENLQKSGTAMSVKDGVIASQMDGRWYVLITLEASKEGAALANKENSVLNIYAVCNPLEKDGTRFVYQGTPYHSYKNSTDASREITIISVVSMLAVIIILFGVFRSPIPIIVSVAAIILSIGSALITTLATFGKIHVLCLVFGTSLIGSCIDYSLHYFINWKANLHMNSGLEIRQNMMKGLSLSLISTVLCFGVLLLAPYKLLKQMALFSMIGLISSYISVIGLYPFIPLPKTEARKIGTVKLMKTPSWYNKKLVGRISISIIFAVPILLILIFHKNVKIENNLHKLYTMEGRQLSDEVEAAKVLQYNPSGWFIVKGDNEADVLQKEEALVTKINDFCVENNYSTGYLGTTLFIPSKAKQEKSREACKKLLALSEYQFDALGYEEEYADALRNEFEKSEGDYISFEAGNIPAFISDSISAAWLGNISESYYSVVLPALVMDNDTYRNFADDDNGIFFISKVADINRDLDKLTKMILSFFIAAYVILFVILRFFYTTKQTFKIISIPILILLVVAAVFAVSNLPLEFFSIVGMILVLGLGLDYIIYMMENEKRHKGTADAILEPYAILLSFITTIISFGALALSTFKPVHFIGLSIFSGLITAYLSSVFYERS